MRYISSANPPCHHSVPYVTLYAPLVDNNTGRSFIVSHLYAGKPVFIASFACVTLKRLCDISWRVVSSDYGADRGVSGVLWVSSFLSGITHPVLSLNPKSPNRAEGDIVVVRWLSDNGRRVVW
jgi:hypothetical protein